MHIKVTVVKTIRFTIYRFIDEFSMIMSRSDLGTNNKELIRFMKNVKTIPKSVFPQQAKVELVGFCN